MTPRRATSNVIALERALRRLRRDRRLDEPGEVLATLAHTSAALVDMVTNDASTSAYAQAWVVAAHAAVLVQSAGQVAPAATPDAYDDMLRELSAVTAAEDERAAAYVAEHQSDEGEARPWDEVEARMAENPTHWPEAG